MAPEEAALVGALAVAEANRSLLQLLDVLCPDHQKKLARAAVDLVDGQRLGAGPLAPRLRRSVTS